MSPTPTALVVAETLQVLEVGGGGDATAIYGRQITNGTISNDDVLAWNSTAEKWQYKQVDELAGGFVNITGDTMTGDLVMTTSDVLPTTTSTGNIGLTTKRWTSMWADALTVTNTLTATTLGGTLSTASQPNVTTMASLTTVGTIVAGAVPADLVTAATFAAGAYSFAGSTIADLGIVTTADINGGTVGGVTLDGTLAGTPTWASSQAITLSTATQPNITSLGTLTELQVDNLNLNGLTVSSSGPLNIIPAAGSAIVLDATISVDAGVVTGATSVTSSVFVGPLTGNVTGNVSGTAGSTTGNAATATALATARAINGVAFDGTAAITVTAAAGRSRASSRRRQTSTAARSTASSAARSPQPEHSLPSTPRVVGR